MTSSSKSHVSCMAMAAFLVPRPPPWIFREFEIFRSSSSLPAIPWIFHDNSSRYTRICWRRPACGGAAAERRWSAPIRHLTRSGPRDPPREHQLASPLSRSTLVLARPQTVRPGEDYGWPRDLGHFHLKNLRDSTLGECGFDVPGHAAPNGLSSLGLRVSGASGGGHDQRRSRPWGSCSSRSHREPGVPDVA